MRNVHKLLALLLSLAMVFALGVTAAAEDVTATPVPISAPEEAPEATAAPGEIVILYTNDVHTYINKTLGYPSIAALKKELAALDKLKGPALAQQRYQMFRAMGQGLPPAGKEES